VEAAYADALRSASTFRALILASLGAFLVLTGCEAGQENAAGEPEKDASDFIVFSGLASGSYLHAIAPDGTGLRPVQLPDACSPKDFTRDGRVLICDETSDPWKQFAVERRDGEWRRVPGAPFPRRANFPAWVSGLGFDAQEWAPARDRIALIRISDSSSGDWWFSALGGLVVADADGAHERVVARNGQAPTWSPDGARLAFARCHVTGAYTDDESADCSIWKTSADGAKPPELLAPKTESAPVWSPDGRLIAFFRKTGRCALVCKQRIFVVPADGGAPYPVGPRLTEPSDLFWLPSSASAAQARVSAAIAAADPLELQRCADIWNRARMQSPTAVANVSIVNDRCQVTTPMDYRDAGFVCWQPVPWSFQCPSHGGRFSDIDPAYRVWNAQLDRGGKLTLLEPPKGPRLRLPKAPPYPMRDGHILPFGSDGRPRPGLTFTKTVAGTCDWRGYLGHQG